MNVYDFDKTIYDGDSTAHFYFYCMKRVPKIALRLPYQGFHFLRFKLGIIDKTTFKSKFFTFFKDLEDYEAFVKAFWDSHESGIFQWYKDNQKSDDVIISASPEFLLKDICGRLGINNLLASEVDPKTGKFASPNCYGEEKVVRYEKVYGNAKIDEFYSDSESDSPLARLAEKSYIIRHGKIVREFFK